MRAPQFTPGPWSILPMRQMDTSGDTIPVADGEHYPTAFVPAWTSKPETKAEAEANANLIAAAPRMYEVLSIIIANAGLIPDPAMGESTDCYAVPIDDIRAAEDVLREARGEQ